MNKKLVDVLSPESFLEFYTETIPYMKKYKILIKINDWIFHKTLKQVGFYYNSQFYEVCCKNSARNAPHKCRCFDLNINGAFKSVSIENRYFRS